MAPDNHYFKTVKFATLSAIIKLGVLKEYPSTTLMDSHTRLKHFIFKR